MNIENTYLVVLITFVLTVSTCSGEMLERFSSVQDLSERADWIGVLRIEKCIPSKKELSFSDTFICSLIVTLKGSMIQDPKEQVECRLIDGSARLDRDGKALDAFSGGYKFLVGESYMTFMSKSGNKLIYVAVEGSVLELPPGFEPANMQGMSVKKAFLRVVSELDRYYSQKAKHAKLQKEVFNFKGD